MTSGTASKPQLNSYAEMARRHMAEHLPDRYAQIPDPAAYFAALGEHVADEVEARTRALVDSTCSTTGDDFMERRGKANMARVMAEEEVLSELVFLAPQATTTDAPTDGMGAYVGADPQMTPGWTPLLPSEDDTED
jgi:hypothetical protein